MSELLDWTPAGPRSRSFGDIYFSAEDGLAESRLVFLQGCGLPEAWAGRRRFVVGELGFGTGLNIAALLDLWRQTRPADARLHIFSVEAHPLAAADAARALAHWPELAALTQPLIARWPGQAPGLHRIEFPEVGAILDLFIGDVAAALSQWTGQADAWFLDGFSPALNPQMWTPSVLAQVAERSAPGARAATFTVAGSVRRALTDAGFQVEKRPGHGRKRERLEARLPNARMTSVRQDSAVRRVAIIGAGIAGAAAARAVNALGGEAIVIEAAHPGAGASGNPAALVTPRLDAGLGPAARLFAQAFARAVQLYAAVPDAVLARGALQLPASARDAARYVTILASDVFEPGTLGWLEAEATTARLGEAASAGLDQPSALVIDPQPVLAAWLGAPLIARVAALAADGDGWRLLDAEGLEIACADAVILAAAYATAELAGELPLQPVRGQASWTEHRPRAIPAAAWGGYILATREGLLFGATHDRDDLSVEVRSGDHDRNLAALAVGLPHLAQGLAEDLADTPLRGRAAIRAVTPDGSPLVGATGRAGVFVLSGLGSRGFSLAPLLAEHVAALALGAPSPLSRDAAGVVDPARFARRAARKGRS